MRRSASVIARPVDRAEPARTCLALHGPRSGPAAFPRWPFDAALSSAFWNGDARSGQSDFVKVDCAACDHVALLAPEALMEVGLRPAAKVLDLKGRFR
jgi:hypothetical protein